MIEVGTMIEAGKLPIAARAAGLAPPPPRGTVDIATLLHWAIGLQQAHKFAHAAGAFDEDKWIYGTGGVDSVAIIQSIGALGTEIDTTPGWQPKNNGCHEDATKVFDQVQAFRFSWPIYRLVMAHAELGTVPDWKPHVVTTGARPNSASVEPVSRDLQGRAVESSHTVAFGVGMWRALVRDRRGSVQEVFATGGRVRDPRLRWRYVKRLEVLVPNVRFTPIAWHDEPEDVVAARLAYSQWHAALGDIAAALNETPTGPHALERWSRFTHGRPAHPWPLEDDERLGRLALEIDLARRELLQLENEDPDTTACGFDTSAVRALDKRGGY